MTPKPPKPLARCYSFAPDSLTRAFITPYVPRLLIVADPQDITVIARLNTFMRWAGEYTFEIPERDMACYGIEMQRQEESPMLLREGTIMQFRKGVMARLTNIHQPYWHRSIKPLVIAGPSPVVVTTLFCYLEFVYLTPEEVGEMENNNYTSIEMLTAVDTVFG